MPKQKTSTGYKPLTKQQFKKLQQKWYVKTACATSPCTSHSSHFNDLNGPNSPEKTFRSHLPAKLRLLTTENYYKIAQTYLKRTKFKKPHQRFIWRLHCQGLTYREIAKRLKLRYGKYSINTVWSVINTHKPRALARAARVLARTSILNLKRLVDAQSSTSSTDLAIKRLVDVQPSSSTTVSTTPASASQTQSEAGLNTSEAVLVKSLLESLYDRYDSGRLKKSYSDKQSRQNITQHIESIVKSSSDQVSLEILKSVEEYNPDTIEDYDPSTNIGILL